MRTLPYFGMGQCFGPVTQSLSLTYLICHRKKVPNSRTKVGLQWEEGPESTLHLIHRMQKSGFIVMTHHIRLLRG